MTTCEDLGGGPSPTPVFAPDRRTVCKELNNETVCTCAHGERGQAASHHDVRLPDPRKVCDIKSPFAVTFYL